MLDLVAFVCFVTFFGLSLLYARACDSLKGKKS